MPSPIQPGAEPWSHDGGPAGALVLHGFTGSPQSMRGLAEAYADAGFAVEMPLLPGHGTAVTDMVDTDWSDWSAEVEAAYERLSARCGSLVVAGLSMGGTLTVWLATRHSEIAGIVCINPAVEPNEPMVDFVSALVDGGDDYMDGVGGDIADPDAVEELAYGRTPLRPLLSLLGAGDGFADQLGDVKCPVLIITSTNDHVVPPSNSDYLAANVGGPVERVILERSFHVATLDYEHDVIEREAVAFARRVTG